MRNIHWKTVQNLRHPVRLRPWPKPCAHTGRALSSYIAETPDGSALVYWNGNEAHQAQRWLDIASSNNPTPTTKESTT